MAIDTKHTGAKAATGIAWLSFFFLALAQQAHSFSMSSNGNNNNNNLGAAMNLMSSDSNNLDRFQSSFLVGKESETAVSQFDGNLWQALYGENNVSGEDEDLWVAVSRSNNNKPSVIVRDEFFRAMNDATSDDLDDANDNDSTANSNNNISTVSNTASFLSNTMPSMLEIPETKPVAIARLQKTESDNVYLLDNLRCSLKKEDQDESCDGGSEFLEALSVAVDTLLQQHLQRLLKDRDDETETDVVFEGTVRTKSTLFSNKLFEERGFREVETLSMDMATHVSSYGACFSQYAERSIEPGMAPGTRDRALQIVALLGRLDAEVQKKVEEDEQNGGSGGDDYDPWANMKLYRS